jgi:hypothetical protein
MKLRNIALSLSQEYAQQKNSHELLSVLRSVHERHARSTADLCIFKERIRLSPVKVSEYLLNHLDNDPAHAETHASGENQTVQDFHPLIRINSRKTALQAIAAPERPAIRAWLSLVGIPNHHAAVAQSTMANRAAQSAISASSELPPKSTILYMVCATVALNMVMINTPRKLHTAAMAIAARGPNDLVETQVAMAFGASVHPFTNMTPRVSKVVITRAGLENS